MSFKPIDVKRDEFRKYLEVTGVLEALSRVFVKLLKIPERPQNAIEFLCENLGAVKEQSDNYQRMKLELQDAQNEIQCLKRTIENLENENKKLLERGSLSDNNNSQNKNVSDDNENENETIQNENTKIIVNESDNNADTNSGNDESTTTKSNEENDSDVQKKTEESSANQQQQQPESA